MNLRAPETLEPADTWRKQAECAKPEYAEDRGLWFPHNSDRETTRAAKSICHGCPVIEQCATWALARRIREGVWGGLSENDRRRIHKRHTWQLQNPAFLASVVTAALANAGGPSLYDAYNQRAEETSGGHTRWTASSSAITVQGRIYTPMQLAFALGHNRTAEGTVRAECGITGCVTPEHLCDGQMRREQRLAKQAAV